MFMRQLKQALVDYAQPLFYEPMLPSTLYYKLLCYHALVWATLICSNNRLLCLEVINLWSLLTDFKLLCDTCAHVRSLC